MILPPEVVVRWSSPLVASGLAIEPLSETGAAVELTRVGAALRLRITPDRRPAKATPMVPDVEGTTVDLSALDGTRFDLSRARMLVGATAATGRLSDAEGEPGGWLFTWDLGVDDGVFGGGESSLGPDLRGTVRRVVNVETHGTSGADVSYLSVPFFWSEAGWGVLVHTGAPVIADLGATANDLAAVAVPSDELDVFLFEGTPAEIIGQYHALTGAPPPLPEWAFGVWTSRCSYLSEQEIAEVVDGYEAAGCPLDVVHVDAWVTGNVVADLTCNWEVDRARFPEGWGRRLAERGVRLSLWHNPYVLAGSPLAAELDAAGLLLRTKDGRPARTPDKADRHLVDFTNPAAVDWWKDRVRETVRSEGAAAFKPDFAEEVPLDAVASDGRSGWELRNEYALRYQRATAEALAEELGEGAYALFCRSGTAGAQRHPCHWVGDTPSTWTGISDALRLVLSLSLSGFSIIGHDVGGFYTLTSFAPLHEAMQKMDGSSLEADVEPLLFARWTQWGAFSPMMRFHGTGRREPWSYPSPAREIAVDACRLRERLKPYLARTAGQSLPMARPMVLAFPGDPSAKAAWAQYLLGDDVLVAPVLAADGTVTLWVPPGEWEPLVGLAPVSGPGWVTVHCRPEQFPAWQRAGTTVLAP